MAGSKVCTGLSCKMLSTSPTSGQKVPFKCSSCHAPYCGVNCQKGDWKYHKRYCEKKAYTFTIDIAGSTDPYITRTVDIPSWYTFRDLHFVIQYAFGPWQCSHLHEFNFKDISSSPTNILFNNKTLLQIAPRSTLDESDEIYAKEFLAEEDVVLSDIWDENGKYRRKALKPDGGFLPFEYLYDFGDNWLHTITFKGEVLARATRPLFSEAIGCGPVEDCGGVYGWKTVKSAFAARNPTRDQLERRKWAGDVSGKGDDYDPLKEVDIVPMNYEARWENHIRAFERSMTGGDDEGDWDEEDGSGSEVSF